MLGGVRHLLAELALAATHGRLGWRPRVGLTRDLLDRIASRSAPGADDQSTGSSSSTLP